VGILNGTPPQLRKLVAMIDCGLVLLTTRK
jgi:hypothetical protein